MQTLALENYGTVEMNSAEMIGIDGGLFPSFINFTAGLKMLDGVYTDAKALYADLVHGYDKCECQNKK